MSIKATNIARDLARQYGLIPPVDVAKLIKDMDIALELDVSLDQISGFAYQKDGKQVIGVNKDDGDLRKKFTMAHELGHMLVHARDDVIFDKAFVYFRDSRSSTGLNPKEVEANAFAAELLMPASRLTQQIANAGGIDLQVDDKKIAQLAKEYGVSHSAMSVRIDSLAKHGVA
jgi:Zn-dependent peptidase ImmA (M78 family)